MVYKPTTVIGSFPDEPGEINYVIDRQLMRGINIVCDGQLRCNMNAYFANTINGFNLNNDGKPILVGEISGLKPAGLDTIITDLRAAQDHLKKNPMARTYDVELKANITGPVTLGFNAALNGKPKGEALKLYDGYYKTDKNGKPVNTRFWKDIGIAMGQVLTAYEAAEVRHIQIDEPQISAEQKSTVPLFKVALKEILAAKRNKDTKIYYHSCGNIAHVYNEIVKLPGICGLSFEFAGTPSNLEIITRESLESNDKKLLLGIIKSSEPEPDDVLMEVYKGITAGMADGSCCSPDLLKAIEPHVKQGIAVYSAAAERVGEENILQINPDCGLGGFKQLGTKATIAAVSKLRILQEIQKRISKQ
jgi:methionine synthase II (cobalamin-independent)